MLSANQRGEPAGQCQVTADRLNRLLPSIIREWEARVQAEIPEARQEGHLVIRDHIPELLRELVDAVARGVPEVDTKRAAERHAAARVRLKEYPLARVVQEYSLLRSVIVEALHAEPPIAPEPLTTIHQVIDRAIQEAAEEYLRLAHEELKQSQEELRQQAQALVEADRRKNEFIATLGHELRNPLGAVSNALFLLEYSELDDQAVRALATAVRQTRQLTRLVDDLQDMSRIGIGKLQLQREPVQICEVAREAAETVEPLIASRHHDLICALQLEPLQVNGDAGRLHQVISNLLNNAARYTDPGGRIWLTVQQEAGQAVVRVRDSGMGIDPALLPYIFELFSQIDVGAARMQGGLGIGLALVKKLVEMHGGTITAQSAGQGQGSEFVVRLPLLRSE